MIFTPGKQRKIIHCNLMQAALGVVQNPSQILLQGGVGCVPLVGRKMQRNHWEQKNGWLSFLYGLDRSGCCIWRQ